MPPLVRVYTSLPFGVYNLRTSVFIYKTLFERRTLHVPNLKQMSKPIGCANLHYNYVRHMQSSTFELGIRSILSNVVP